MKQCALSDQTAMQFAIVSYAVERHVSCTTTRRPDQSKPHDTIEQKGAGPEDILARDS